jgi:mono/diheme cytochrome c family protein
MRNFAIILLLVCLCAACSPGGPSLEARGKLVFTEHCASCHSLDPGVVIVGPPLAGVVGRAGAQGTEPQAFLEQAILTPAAEIVPGFQNLMPADFERRLSPSDQEALFAFLLTLE